MALDKARTPLLNTAGLLQMPEGAVRKNSDPDDKKKVNSSKFFYANK